MLGGVTVGEVQEQRGVLETAGGKVEHRQRVLSEGSLGQEGMTPSLIPWHRSWSLLAFVNHKLSPGTHYVRAAPHPPLPRHILLF